MRYRKKPVVIEAHQWFMNGQHPEDDCKVIRGEDIEGEGFLTEGKIVRRYNHPDVAGSHVCGKCGISMNAHGWIDTLEGGHTVCVGDWIIKGIKGEFYPCKPDIFEATYDKVEEA